ncbi:RNA polymerase sigma factor SigE [Propionicicella superfundia]|uniref:RNA polymerase sigma factor SigE n=1 Tax=Propionicicella superfundia TaxID=348582 RepID=UPI0003FCCF7D|nr:RNA polymerase sigma factor SigE [Propionicicella superfundia]
MVWMRRTSPKAAPAWTPPTWEELVATHSAPVYRLAYRLTGNRFDAEDLTQEVFIKAYRSINQFQPGTLSGWLHRITTNLFLDGARKRARVRVDNLSEQNQVADTVATPDEIVHDADLDHDIAAALGHLNPQVRAAVVLCDIEGLSYEEVAAVLDVKIGTVRSRIHRGRSQLREALAHRAPGRGRSRYLGIDAIADEVVRQ